MSKKHRKLKRRIKRSRQGYQNECMANDRHHLLWVGKKWNGYWASKLRLYPWLIVPIPKCTLHKQIHQEMSGIPVPSEPHCREAYNALVDLEKRGALSPKASVETRLEVLICLLDCIEIPTANALKHELAIVKKFYTREH